MFRNVDSKKDIDVCIVGGCGHVGLPLGIAFAENNATVALYDINEAGVNKINDGELPFMEEGAEQLLKDNIQSGRLEATNDVDVVSEAKVVIMVIGTPVDEHLNPKVHEVLQAVREIEDYLQDDQLLVLRSTLYPGMTDKIAKYLKKQGKKTMVAFCPERIAEGHALKEIYELPQIVAGCSPEATKRAKALFGLLTMETIVTSPIEAELAKLFTNTWRYINFAISNQFYMIANQHGLDFYNIYDAMTKDYPRLKAFAKAGLAAGPCLFKDTMQLSSFSNNNFFLGQAAMLINEGLPDFVVNAMNQKSDLSTKTVALLGMAFKGDNDDPRESLSFKLKKRLEIEAAEVLCNDPYINRDDWVDLETVREKADIVVIAAPHSVYRHEDWSGKEVVDIWNFYGNGGLV